MVKSAPGGKNTALKIIIPALIVLTIAGIWAVKNLPRRNDESPDYALEADENTDIEKLKSYGLPIIIEFGAEWCGPCQIMAPIIRKLNEDTRGKAIVKYCDTDENPGFASRYNFQYIPTQLFITADGTPFNPPDAAAREIVVHQNQQTGLPDYTTHTGTLTEQELMDILKEMGMK